MTIEAVFKALVRPGMTVVEGGSGLGSTAGLLAGCGAVVHTFEPYRELRERAMAEVGEAPVTFHSSLLGGETGEADFYAAPGHSAVFSTRNRDLLHFHPDAEMRRVSMIRLDDSGIDPDLIYLDIEGSEYEALRGAAQLLRRRGPDLVIQTHGLELDGIGGNLLEFCTLLRDFGYGLFDLESGHATTPTRYVAAYGQKMAALAAFRGLETPERLADVTAALRT